MHIAIDGHTIGTQLAGNVTYITGLLEGLASVDQQNRYTVYVFDKHAEDRYLDRWPNVRLKLLDIGSGRIARHLWSFRKPLQSDRPDVFFVQFNAPRRIECKLVTAIHDLSFQHLPETFRWHEAPRMRFAIRGTANRSDHIVTCSESSRQDILRNYGLPESRVTTEHLAAPGFLKPVTDPERLLAIRKKYDLPDDFILGLGSIQPRKNLERLIAAYAQLSRKQDVPPLILVGKLAWLHGSSVDAAARYGVADRVTFTGFVPDEDLATLYSAATIFVYPSFFEGFGLPPLEAMQCGTPVITGDRTSLPEVVGDAGIMVDPYDVNAIADAMQRLLNDANLRADLTKRGIERAKNFSWAKAARETLGVFERVMSKSK
ncbi:MAG: glycosyltransferase family 4 protein [Pyrinomonadaceae bacterium]